MLTSNTGIQLYPYSFRTLHNSINFVQNIFVNLLTICVLYSSSIFGQRSFGGIAGDGSKPLMVIFFNLFVTQVFPSLAVFSVIHYTVIGPRILPLLENPRIRPTAHQPNARRSLFLLFLFQAVLFIFQTIGNIPRILSFSTHPISKILTLCCLFVFKSKRHFHYFIFHYLQWGTLQTLTSIRQKLALKSTTLDLKCLQQFIELAKTNEQLYRLLSLQTLVYYIIFAVNAMVFFFGRSWSHAVYPVVNSAYIIYLVTLNKKISSLVEEIIAEFQDRFRGQLRQSVYKTKTKENFFIKCHEVALYRGSFEIRIFSFSLLNCSYLLSTVLLISNYLVFIYQTK